MSKGNLNIEFINPFIIGASMVYTSIVLFAGFIIFAGSNFGGTIALGKLTSITLLIAMLILSAVGYVANAEQTAKTTHTLRLLMSLYPALFAVLTAVITGFFKINSKMEKELETAMKEMSQASE